MLYNIHHTQQLANASLAASPQKKPALVRQLAGKDDLSSHKVVARCAARLPFYLDRRLVAQDAGNYQRL